MVVNMKHFSSPSPSTTLVCDIGSCAIKIGTTGKLTPEAIIPCLVGSPRNYHWKSYKDADRQTLIGVDALMAGKRQKIGYHYPMSESGGIQDWKTLEILFQKAIKSLGVTDCSQHKILITRPYHMKRADIATLLDLFIIKFGFRAVTMHDQAALVLYTQGIESGLVVEMGESMVHIVPVYKGHAIPNIDKSLAVGGKSITSHLLKLLRLKGYLLNEKEDFEVVRQIKENFCYVTTNQKEDERLAAETTVLVETIKLPDGTIISLGRERFDSVEVLFKPSLVNCESRGLVDMIFEVIQEADIDCRADLYRNIIISGGTSLFPGMQERMDRDLNQRYLRDILQQQESRSLGWKPNVHAPESREHLVFEGAALFADLISDDKTFWVTQKEYMQGGIQSVLNKCNIN